MEYGCGTDHGVTAPAGVMLSNGPGILLISRSNRHSTPSLGRHTVYAWGISLFLGARATDFQTEVRPSGGSNHPCEEPVYRRRTIQQNHGYSDIGSLAGTGPRSPMSFLNDKNVKGYGIRVLLYSQCSTILECAGKTL